MSAISLRKFTLASLIFIFANFLQAKGFSPDNFPSKEEVFEKTKGGDQQETLLKQFRVFGILRTELTFIPDDEKSPKQIKLQNEYEESIKIIQKKYNQEFGDFESDIKEYNKDNSTKDIENFIVNNLFDEKTRNDWNEREKRIGTRNAQFEKPKDKSKSGIYLPLIFICIVISLNMFFPRLRNNAVLKILTFLNIPITILLIAVLVGGFFK